MIATEKKTPSFLVDEKSILKISQVCDNIGFVYSGMGPDARVLLDKARKSAQEYRRVYQEDPPTLMLVKDVASVMQEYTQSGFASLTQRCASVWSLVADCWRRRKRSVFVPSRSLWIILGVESECNWQKHGQCQDIPRKEVLQLIQILAYNGS